MRPAIVSFRVRTPFLGVVKSSASLVTIPTGAIIELDREPRGLGLIEVTLRGEDLLAFHRDLEERAERLEAQSELLRGPGMALTTKHRELIEAELQIIRTLLDIGQSKIAIDDTDGASRAIRNAETAIEGIHDLGALEMSENGHQLLIEFLDLQKRTEDLREKIGAARRTISKAPKTAL